MNELKYTTSQLHTALYKYLLKKLEEQNQALAIMQMLENEVPGVLREYFGAAYNSIYELQDTDVIKNYQEKIQLHPVLNNIDIQMDPGYTDALKWYRLFVKSLASGAISIPVPGEEEDKQIRGGVTPGKKLSTIYVEGESAESQPKEIRRRNKELRDACIAYFKTLHDGRIICECCGFNFSKAFDMIDEYIEVHHRYPFSLTEGEHEVDAIKDLVPLCANCHRMIHHFASGQGSCISVDELKKKYLGIHYN